MEAKDFKIEQKDLESMTAEELIDLKISLEETIEQVEELIKDCDEILSE